MCGDRWRGSDLAEGAGLKGAPEPGTYTRGLLSSLTPCAFRTHRQTLELRAEVCRRPGPFPAGGPGGRGGGGRDCERHGLAVGGGRAGPGCCSQGAQPQVRFPPPPPPLPLRPGLSRGTHSAPVPVLVPTGRQRSLWSRSLPCDTLAPIPLGFIIVILFIFSIKNKKSHIQRRVPCGSLSPAPPAPRSCLRPLPCGPHLSSGSWLPLHGVGVPFAAPPPHRISHSVS